MLAWPASVLLLRFGFLPLMNEQEDLPADTQGGGLKAEEEAVEDQPRAQAAAQAQASTAKTSETKPGAKTNTRKTKAATDSSEVRFEGGGLPQQVGRGQREMLRSFATLTRQGAPLNSPYLREVAGGLRAPKQSCPCWSPSEVDGPTVEVRNSAAAEMPTLSWDLSRHLRVFAMRSGFLRRFCLLAASMC